MPFYDDKADEEMLHLMYYLKCLSQFEDIREQNRKAFQLKELERSNLNEFLDSFCGNGNAGSDDNQSEMNAVPDEEADVYQADKDCIVGFNAGQIITELSSLETLHVDDGSPLSNRHNNTLQ